MSKVKIIKIVKDHVSGLKKGSVLEAPPKIAERLKSQGYADYSTKKELESYLSSNTVKDKSNLYKEAKERANSSNSECEGCGGDCGECGDKDEDLEHLKYTLTQEDIDANPEETEGLKAGDIVLLTEDSGDLAIGEDGKVIKSVA